MPTECSLKSMSFARVDGRAVVADFGGGAITSDAGALLLRATDRAIRLVDRFAACFSDGRMPGRVSISSVVRIARRWVTGMRRCAMQASKSSSKQATAEGRSGMGALWGQPIERDEIYAKRTNMEHRWRGGAGRWP